MSETSNMGIETTIAERMLGMEDTGPLLTEGLWQLLQLLGTDVAELWLSGVLCPSLAIRVESSGRATKAPVFVSGERLVGVCMRSRLPVTIYDLSKDGETPADQRDAEYRGFAASPVSLGSRTLGAVSVATWGVRAFSPTDQQILDTAATFFGIATHHLAFFPEHVDSWKAVTQGIGTLTNHFHPAKNRSLPKGVSDATLSTVVDLLLQSGSRVSCRDVAERLKISNVTARNYLSYLSAAGLIKAGVVHGRIGRPKYYYTVSGSEKARLRLWFKGQYLG